jgi:AAA domain
MATAAVQVAVEPAVQTPGIYSYEGLLALAVNAPQYAVEGLINEGQTALFAGYFGVGKTMFAGQLSIALATGRGFLGRRVHRPFKTIFLDFETGPGAIKERLARQVEAARLTDEEVQLLGQNWIYVNAMDEACSLYGLQMNATGFEKLADFVNQQQAEVLIIDNLGWFVDGDLQDSEDVRKLYQSLRELKTTCSSLKNGLVLMLHHLVKPTGDRTNRCSLLTAPREYLSLARGSQRLLDFAECRLALAEEVSDGQVLHLMNGVNRTAVVDPLIIQLSTETLSFDLHEDAQLRYTQAFEGKAKQRQIFEALPKLFSWTEALRTEVEGKRVTKDTLSNTLRTASLNKFVSREEDGRYTKLYPPR